MASMGAAALPARAGQGRADRDHQAGVRVGSDELNAGQAAGGEVAEERQPAGPVLTGGGLQARISRCPSALTPAASSAWTFNDPTALTDLEHQGVNSDERVRARVQRPGPERLDLSVELFSHHADLRLRRARDAQSLDELVHPARRDPEQVAGRPHGRQGPLGALAMLEQPVREVRPGP